MDAHICATVCNGCGEGWEAEHLIDEALCGFCALPVQALVSDALLEPLIYLSEHPVAG